MRCSFCIKAPAPKLNPALVTPAALRARSSSEQEAAVVHRMALPPECHINFIIILLRAGPLLGPLIQTKAQPPPTSLNAPPRVVFALLSVSLLQDRHSSTSSVMKILTSLRLQSLIFQ